LAEELLQETFLQIHRSRRTYLPGRPVTPWIFSIAHHVYLGDRRARIKKAGRDLSIEDKLALLFGFVLVRAGLPFRARTTGLLLGLGNGLAVEAVWRLHCPFSSWGHILLFHGGAVVVLMAAGMAIGRLWERKA